MKNTWFIASRLVGQIPVREKLFYLRHVLGKRIVIADEATLKLFHRYRLPRKAGTDANKKNFKLLIEANLIRMAGSYEKAWIEGASERANKMQEPLRAEPASLFSLIPFHNQSIIPNPSFVIDEKLKLSECLAIAILNNGTVLITHPLYHPVYIAQDLWQFAQQFKDGNLLNPKHIWAADFLVRNKILWPEGEEYCSAAREEIPQNAPCLINHAGDRFFQFWRPYTLETVNRPATTMSLALIGPCLAQQHLECLRYMALANGIHLEAHSFLDLNSKLKTLECDVVFYHPGKLLPSLIQAAVLNDIDFCHEIALKIEVVLQKEIQQLLTLTQGLILIPLFTWPKVSSVAAGSQLDMEVRKIILRINTQLSLQTEQSPSLMLVDEEREYRLFNMPHYRDDIYTASTHNAPISSWTYSPSDPELQILDPKIETTSVCPPIPIGQTDPSLVLAMAIFRTLLYLHINVPIELIIFEPNELLWRGSLIEDNIMTIMRGILLMSVENYAHSGAHEALRGLAARGVDIGIVSSASTNALNLLLDEFEDYPYLIRRNTLKFMQCGPKNISTIREAIAIAEKKEERTLLIDFTMKAPEDFRGRVFHQIDRWQLKRYLVTAPELAGKTYHRSTKQIEKQAVLNGNGTSTEVNLATIIDQLLVSDFNVAPSEVAAIEYFADVGIDSLGIMRLIAKLEKQLNLPLPSWEKLVDGQWQKRRLLNAVQSYIDSARGEEIL